MSEELKSGTAMGLLDLSQFDSLQKSQEAGIDVDIYGPDGRNPIGIKIKVAGPDSDRVRDATERLRQERIDSENTRPLTAAELEDRQIRGLAMATMGWTPEELTLDGKKIRYTEDNAFRVYKRFPFIRDQVFARANNRMAFSKPSKSDSSSPSSAGSEG